MRLELIEFGSRIGFIEMRGQTSQSGVFRTQPEARVCVRITSRIHIVGQMYVLHAWKMSTVQPNIAIHKDDRTHELADFEPGRIGTQVTEKGNWIPLASDVYVTGKLMTICRLSYRHRPNMKPLVRQSGWSTTVP